ncbi:PAAR domain-containing protein [Variovorax rhizosphaerae]|uniref:PAAR domain-containing protein n=1 Tax=Variovorax rhizosphaerae TaxID=1836200 RepID=A0ABU8WC13_9BURK
MLFPAAKMNDMVIGLDFHAVIIPPVVAPIPMVPHPYFGPIYLWMTPTFPTCNVLINGQPAVTAGGMGYYVHIPMGLPAPPSVLNLAYWTRYLTNIPKSLMLVALTLLANLAISGISSMFVKPDSATGQFVKDVTGVDTSSWSGVWDTIKGSFAAYTKWQTWVKLLMPPVPYPGGQGSAAIGSPSVTVNGGPLGFVCPLMATSCSDLPIVPNAATVGFSNVMVGVSLGAMVRALAVNAAQGAVSAGVSKGVEKLGERGKRQGAEGCGCEPPA